MIINLFYRKRIFRVSFADGDSEKIWHPLVLTQYSADVPLDM